MKELLLITLTLTTFISNGQSKIFGQYCRHNPVADHGITTIVSLNEDSTFNYEFIGHMTHEKAKGKYYVTKDNTILLNYDTLSSDDFMTMTLEIAPKIMTFKNDKLFELDKRGHLIRSKRLLSFHRRFYLFGDYSRRRKVYLIRESNKYQCK